MFREGTPFLAMRKYQRVWKLCTAPLNVIFVILIVLYYGTLHGPVEFMWHIHQIHRDANMPEDVARALGLDINKNLECVMKNVGTDGEGGYPVCLGLHSRSECNVLSFGIFDDPSFDQSLGSRGCRVDSYDPTINRTTGPSPWAGHSSKFYGEGIGGRDGYNHRLRWNEVSIKTAIKRLQTTPGSSMVDIMKMDIEGSEWAALRVALDDGVFDSPITVKQIVMEVHIGTEGGDMSNDIYDNVDTWDDNENVLIADPDGIVKQFMVLRDLRAKGYSLYFRRPVGSIWNRRRYVTVCIDQTLGGGLHVSAAGVTCGGEVVRIRSAYDIGLIKVV
jgi:hypothetical protein